MSPATSHKPLEGSSWQLDMAAKTELDELSDELLNYFDPQNTDEHQQLVLGFDSAFVPADQTGQGPGHGISRESLFVATQNRDVFQQTTRKQPDFLWSPAPSVPEFLRNEVTLSLARGLDSDTAGPEAFPRQASNDSSACGDSHTREEDIAKHASGRDAYRVSSYERKLEITRQAQKRFRARRKARCPLHFAY